MRAGAVVAVIPLTMTAACTSSARHLRPAISPTSTFTSSSAAPPSSQPVQPTTTTTPTPARALSVPFGVYVSASYTGGVVTYIGALRMRSDGTYSQKPSSGHDIPDPDTGQSGTYQIVSSTSIQYLTGPYAGSSAGLYPNYKGSGYTYIDVLFNGTTTSYQYTHA